MKQIEAKLNFLSKNLSKDDYLYYISELFPISPPGVRGWGGRHPEIPGLALRLLYARSGVPVGAVFKNFILLFYFTFFFFAITTRKKGLKKIVNETCM